MSLYADSKREWLNEATVEKGINFSQTLQDALINQLPMLGGWSSANATANIEELVAADIDVIFVTAPPNDNLY